MPVKVLIIDDSALVRQLLTEGQWGPSVADSRILVDRLSLDLLYCFDPDSSTWTGC